MIKNFVVKVKQIKFGDKGLKNLLNYLKDKKRHSDGIVNFNKLSNVEKFFNNTFVNIQHYEAKRRFNGIAGRGISSYGDSFIFTIPPEFYDKVNNEEKLKKLTLNIVKKFYNQMKNIFEYEKEKLQQKLNETKDEKEIIKIKKELKKYKEFINYDTFINNIFLNIHTNKHIHFNIVIPRIYNENGNYFSNRITNRKNFLNRIKQQWNLAVLEELEINYKDYKPKTKFHKGYKNQYFKDLIEENNKVLTEIESKEKEIKELKEIIEMKRKNINEYTKKILEETEELKEENNRKEKIIKAFQLTIRYYKSINDKVQKNEMKSIFREFNKIESKIAEVESLTKNKNINKITKQIKSKINQWKRQMKM